MHSRLQSEAFRMNTGLRSGCPSPAGQPVFGSPGRFQIFAASVSFLILPDDDQVPSLLCTAAASRSCNPSTPEAAALCN